MRRCFALALALGLAAPTALAAGPETVSFPGTDGLTLTGEVFTPAGPGRHPAVVALHGCGGLYGSGGELGVRHQDWGERLSAQGFLVLLPDSFGPRGFGSQCRNASRTIKPRLERVDDAIAARRYLQGRADVDPKAIALLGWSNGGSTVLYSVMPDARSADEPDFVRAVAFYPGCRVPLERGWHTRMPLMILIGTADDWTPSAPCETLAREAASRGEPVELVLYPGAYHDFDYPDMKVRIRRGLAYSANADGVAHAGTDPAARADALIRVPAFLAR